MPNSFRAGTSSPYHRLLGSRTPSDRRPRFRSILNRARSRATQLDWGFLLALAVGLFAASPFLLRPGLPRHTDAELHIYRAAELGHIIREGVLYPRWSPNLYLGYGYPIFHYYAPLTYYLSNIFSFLLPGVGIVGGVKAVFVVGLLVASVGTYLLGRELFGPEPAVIAATAFVLCPYVLFIDPHARGVLAEHFAISLTPLSFYFFHRLMRVPTRRTLSGSALLLGAVVFSHNLTGLVVSGLLAGYWIWQVLVVGRRRHWQWGPMAFALAAALVAFFWLPALLERGAVKLDVIGPGHFDFREHFLSLTELLAPSRRIDWGATGPRYRHNLGLGQWILAIPACLATIRRIRLSRTDGAGKHLAFFFCAGLGLSLLMTRPSTFLWEAIPVMPYLQFPWRLLGVTNLMLAICAAGSIALLPDGLWRRAAVTGSFVLIILTALPLFYPPPWPADFGGTTPADILDWERESQALGTTSTGDFLPVTVEMIPPPMDTLVRSYRDDGPIDKVNRATLPDGARVTVVEHKPNSDRFRVVTPTGFVLRLYTFYFPGWRAYLNGERVDIEIARPEGFITVEIPEGTHDVLVRFETTGPRMLGGIVSAVALLALGVILVGWRGEREAAVLPTRGEPTPATWLPLVAALLLIVLVKGTVLDPHQVLYHHSAPGDAAPAQHRLYAEFGDQDQAQIELIGHDLRGTALRPGDTLSVVLYWRALTDVGTNYQSFVHVAQPLDVAWAQEDHLNPGGLPTSRWPTDRYVWDEYAIRLPQQLPPGTYLVNVGLYSLSDGGRRLQWRDGTEAARDSIVIGSVEVVSPGSR